MTSQPPTQKLSVDEQAAALVAAVDPEVVSAVLAQFPDPDQIEFRRNWQELGQSWTQKIPRDPAPRSTWLAAEIVKQRQTLESDIAKYEHLRTGGVSVLLAYDVCISSGGNPVAALHTALRLKSAHISYGKSIIKCLVHAQDELQAELSSQMGLF